MDQRKEAAAPNTRHTVATSEYCINTELPAGYLLVVLTLWRWKTTNQHTVWCWEHWTSTKVISQEHAK